MEAGLQRLSDDALLTIEGLQTSFRTERGFVPAVDGVSFSVRRGECVGVVGESGCGKTLTALSILGLVPKPGGAITGGRILFEGRDLLKMTEAELRDIRGNRISMIFQEPMTSLNPVYTIGTQMTDVIALHQGLGKRAARESAIEMLRLVGIPDPAKRMDDYPHNLSGGMRQRVMIAMALSCRPKLIIADEPTTALDVTIQAQILETLKELRQEIGLAVLLITHALGVIAEMAERVIVMYAGKVVEEAPVGDLFHSPAHPYTVGLLQSIPKIDGGKEPLHVIDGVVPNLGAMPAGCRFHPRCPKAKEVCSTSEPPEVSVGPGHFAACWLAEGGSR